MEDALKKKAKGLWSRAVVFNGDGKILASTYPATPSEISALTTILDDYDSTIGQGAKLDGEEFVLTRFYDEHSPAYVSGRSGQPQDETGEGFCVARHNDVFALVTFKLPTVSARAVSELFEFMKQEC